MGTRTLLTVDAHVDPMRFARDLARAGRGAKEGPSRSDVAPTRDDPPGKHDVGLLARRAPGAPGSERTRSCERAMHPPTAKAQGTTRAPRAGHESSPASSRASAPARS